MRKIYCTKCERYIKPKNFVKPKISYKCYKTLILSSICNRCGSKDEQMFKQEESIDISKILGLINDIEEYQKIYNHV